MSTRTLRTDRDAGSAVPELPGAAYSADPESRSAWVIPDSQRCVIVTNGFLANGMTVMPY